MARQGCRHVWALLTAASPGLLLVTAEAIRKGRNYYWCPDEASGAALTVAGHTAGAVHCVTHRVV